MDGLHIKENVNLNINEINFKNNQIIPKGYNIMNGNIMSFMSRLPYVFFAPYENYSAETVFCKIVE